MDAHRLPLIRSALLSQFPNVAFGMSTRQGEDADAPFGFNLGFGVGDDPARVERNLALFLDALRLSPDDVAFMDQVHEDRITIATEPGVHPSCDAMITREPLLGLAVRVADCIPVALFAPGSNTIGVVHAGWRGAAEHLPAKTVRAITETSGSEPGGMFAFIGPGAGACCYEVGEDISALFPPQCVYPHAGGRPHLDLHAAVLHQLVDAGIPRANIEVEARCTICSPALFHSHRRDGARAGRMLAVFCLTHEAV